MKLGLITDIHEQLDPLREALSCFAEQQVDQIVVIGDLAADGELLDETCRALAEVGAIGVWGNHDFGMCPCNEPDPSEVEPTVLDFMGTLEPRLVVDDCLFTHVEPWLDTTDIADLWFFGGLPDSEERIEKIFGSGPQRVMFAGHYHRWLLATPDGITEWDGSEPISLIDDRYYMIVAAACEGHWATYDTSSGLLTPFTQKRL